MFLNDIQLYKLGLVILVLELINLAILTPSTFSFLYLFVLIE